MNVYGSIKMYNSDGQKFSPTDHPIKSEDNQENEDDIKNDDEAWQIIN